MLDHFGIHQNVPIQELFELFIDYYKFYKQENGTGLYVTDHCIYLPVLI